MDDDPILAKAKQLHEAGATPEQVRGYLLSHGYESAAPPAPAPTGHAGKPFVDAPEIASAQGHAGKPFINAQSDPSDREQITGGIASLIKDVPGGERLQAKFRSGFLREPYGQALQDVQGAEETAAPAVRTGNRMAGGTLAALALPGNAAAQGGAFGASTAALDTRDESLGERGARTALGGIVGIGLGKGADAATTLARAKLPTWLGGAPSLGRNALDRKAATSAADKIAYGQAEAEGAAAAGQPTPPEITAALNKPDIKPFADEVRSLRQFANADDYTVLREAYKMQSEYAGSLKTRMLNANDFKAGSSGEARSMGLAKQEMLSAADAPISVRPPMETAQSPAPDVRQAIERMRDQSAAVARRTPEIGTTWNANARVTTPAQDRAVSALDRHEAEGVVDPALQGAPSATEQFAPAMPSFRKAVTQHADMAQTTDAFNEGADATKRVLGGKQPAAKKLVGKSPEAFSDYIKTLDAPKADAATEGVLGRLDNATGLSANPFTAFGAGPALTKANAIAPFVRALDTQRGNESATLLRALGISALTPQ